MPLSFVKMLGLRNHWLHQANEIDASLQNEKDPIKQAEYYAAIRVLKFCVGQLESEAEIKEAATSPRSRERSLYPLGSDTVR